MYRRPTYQHMFIVRPLFYLTFLRFLSLSYVFSVRKHLRDFVSKKLLFYGF
jgi:hypothetical protein